MLLPFLLALEAAWLMVLSYIIWRIRKSQMQLFSSSGKQNVEEILNQILQNEDGRHQQWQRLHDQLTRLQEHSQYHLQKIGIVHFNPFGRVGNEQSFVIALLDELNNGLVMNFIYTHEGVRVYTKKIKQGNGLEYELSGEEKTAIAQVQPIK
ncbi:MAG: DUF4446 family protein [Patescibacteria group bacterium]|nr:DUF4446 family protein [Patescibacteria group bacterium]